VPNDRSRLDGLFARQAAATPEAPAILHRGRMVTYADLAARAEGLAAQLVGHGVGPGVIVAVCLRRTPNLVALLLAVLEAGGAFLPLDPRYPPERMTYVLADSRAGLLIADIDSPAWAGFGGAILDLSDGALVPRATGAPAAASGPPELAYVIYTSGSTGAPKGVMLGHGATHLVAWARTAFSDAERARVAATTSLSFDPSIFEIFMPLCTGGAVILKENALEAFAADEQPAMLDTVPSVLTELLRADALPASLKVLNIGGEALRGDLVREVFRRRPDLRVLNHYGPTEATTVATVAELSAGLAGDPPIGRPVRGAEITLRTPEGAEAPAGEVGEIHIGGRGLALGYLHRPDLTAEKFPDGPGGRAYRTGDLAAWRDGELHFAGRADRQVKIRGFRIELGEVEAALRRVPGVRAALVSVGEAARRAQLVSHVEADPALTPGAVRAALAAWLPDYMIPADVAVMAAFPRLPSGKVDHAALPQPRAVPRAARADAATGLEKAIGHVFEEVLGRDRVGPDDSFFKLGGDSLASVRAALRLEEILGHELPAALIHHAATPRALAAALEHARLRADSHLTLLEAGGPGAPLFCLADLFGHAFNYLSLARRLAPDRPVYGLSPGPMQDAFTAGRDVRQLTRQFIAEMRALQPAGPYHIAGYSAGGLLAFDLACALEDEGEQVRLVLLDSVLHSRRPTARTLRRWALRHARLMLAGRARRPGAPGTAGLVRELVRKWRPTAPPDWLPRAQVAFAAALIKVGATYRPGAFLGDTLVVAASERGAVDQLFDGDGLLGWSEALRGRVVRAAGPGGHHQFMRDPGVGDTALAVREFLAGAPALPRNRAPRRGLRPSLTGEP